MAYLSVVLACFVAVVCVNADSEPISSSTVVPKVAVSEPAIVPVASVNAASEPISSSTVVPKVAVSEPAIVPVASVNAASEPISSSTVVPKVAVSEPAIVPAATGAKQINGTNPPPRINYTWKETRNCCTTPDLYTKDSHRSCWLKAKAAKNSTAALAATSEGDMPGAPENNATKPSHYKERGCPAECNGKFLNVVNANGELDMSALEKHVDALEKNNSKWSGVIKSALNACRQPDSIAYPVNQNQTCKSGLNEMNHCITNQLIMTCPSGVRAEGDKCSAIINQRRQDSEKRTQRIKEQKERKIARELKLAKKTSTTAKVSV